MLEFNTELLKMWVTRFAQERKTWLWAFRNANAKAEIWSGIGDEVCQNCSWYSI